MRPGARDAGPLAPEARDCRPYAPYQPNNEREQPLQPPRLADSDHLAHDQAQVEPPDVDQETLGDVVATFEVRASHAAGLVAVGEGAFDQLATLAHQALAAHAASPAAVGV